MDDGPEPDQLRFVGAEVVVPCIELDATLDFLTDRLGFRVEAISPADDPVCAVVSGFGVRLRLDPQATGAPPTLRLLYREREVAAGGEHALPQDRRVVAAPNGMTIEFADADPPLVVPPLVASLTVSRGGDERAWGVGRAGMQYRDLVPDRQGGRFIASHIRIPVGGPVPDYVHFHRIRFQMIYCVRGWVKVVYEDQGDPFVMHAGDCVLQPPLIRHRVLESSAGMEVVEIGSPAVHDTYGDLDMTLPTGRLLTERDFGGQRFVRHVAAGAVWSPWRHTGFEFRDTGIESATGAMAAARVVRAAGARSTPEWRHRGELWFGFVLGGEATVEVAEDACADDAGAPSRSRISLASGDSIVVPAETTFSLASCSPDLELLEVLVRDGATSAT